VYSLQSETELCSYNSFVWCVVYVLYLDRFSLYLLCILWYLYMWCFVAKSWWIAVARVSGWAMQSDVPLLYAWRRSRLVRRRRWRWRSVRMERVLLGWDHSDRLRSPSDLPTHKVPSLQVCSLPWITLTNLNVFLAQIIPMIRFTKDIWNLLSKFAYHCVVLT